MNESVRNVGQLFEESQFSEVHSSSEWSSDELKSVRRQLEELLEKREPRIEAGLDEMENQYFWASYILRKLGYVHSVSEPTPNRNVEEDLRPDFTLFGTIDDFRNALPNRGHREFFAPGLAVVRCFAWGASLDEYPEGNDGPANPAYEIDRLLRATGLTWGILTNGIKWRLFHRDTSGLFTTFFEVDLVDALGKADDTFKYFWIGFSREALTGTDGSGPIVQRLLH